MTEDHHGPNRQAALERRHDGPIPQDASVPTGHDAPWHIQLENRRRDSWQEVRRIGWQAVAAKREFDEINTVTAMHEWLRYRKNLKWALKNWRLYYNWHRDVLVERELERMATE